MFRTASYLMVSALCQSAVAAEPSALPPVGDPELVGVYRIVAANGPQTTSGWRGFAAITRSCGIISNHDGTQPLPFRFITAKHRGQNLIDLTIPGDGDRNTLYGIYEISDDTLRICFATEDITSAHGRPVSFDAADPKVASKLVLKRVPLDEAEATRHPTRSPGGMLTDRLGEYLTVEGLGRKGRERAKSVGVP